MCFCCYILFSRKPDYFDSDYTQGVIERNGDFKKLVAYSVDNTSYKTSLEGWGAAQFTKGQSVQVIYNPSLPSEASVYSFFNYWLKLPELLFSACGFLLLFFAAVRINGKQETYYYTDEEKRKKRKYDD